MFRFLEALRSACIPVILSDEWVLPFSEVIDWSESVVFGQEGTALFVIWKLIKLIIGPVKFQIHTYLSAITDDTIFRMRQINQLIYSKYFSSIERIVYSTIEVCVHFFTLQEYLLDYF